MHGLECLIGLDWGLHIRVDSRPSGALDGWFMSARWFERKFRVNGRKMHPWFQALGSTVLVG